MRKAMKSEFNIETLPVEENIESKVLPLERMAPPLDRIVASIRGDAAISPNEYLDDVTVPKGGE